MLIAIVCVVIAIYAILAVRMPRAALVTSPFAAVSLALLAAVYDDMAGVWLSPFVFTTAVLGVVFSTDEEDNWARKIAILLLQIAGGGVLLAVAVFIWPLAVLLSPVFITLIVRYFMVARNSDSLYVISTIGSAMRQNLPLGMALDTAAGSHSTRRARIMREIAKWLSRGCSLSEAIRLGWRKCPSEAMGMIVAAEKSNQLPKAIRSIEADMVVTADESRRVRPIDLSYPLIVISIACVIMLGLCIFIVPTFAVVLSDMSDGEIALPDATQTLLDMSGWIMGNKGLNAFVVFMLAFMVVCVSIFVRFRRRRIDKPHSFSMLGDSIKWCTPFYGWFERNYSLLRLVSLLKVSLNAGVPVNESIKNALELDTNWLFRKRLTHWLRRVEAGEAVSVAARKSDMGRTIAWAFDESINAGNTPDILEAMEEFYRSNYKFKINVARSVITPFLILGLGAAVGYFVYAVFIPMFTIIAVATDGITP